MLSNLPLALLVLLEKALPSRVHRPSAGPKRVMLEGRQDSCVANNSFLPPAPGRPLGLLQETRIKELYLLLRYALLKMSDQCCHYMSYFMKKVEQWTQVIKRD